MVKTEPRFKNGQCVFVVVCVGMRLCQSLYRAFPRKIKCRRYIEEENTWRYSFENEYTFEFFEFEYEYAEKWVFSTVEEARKHYIL